MGLVMVQWGFAVAWLGLETRSGIPEVRKGRKRIRSGIPKVRKGRKGICSGIPKVRKGRKGIRGGIPTIRRKGKGICYDKYKRRSTEEY